jgi:hypothetical protein
MRFGMEVWFPRTQDAKRGVAQLGSILVDALKEYLGIPRSSPLCHHRRCLTTSVFLCEFGLPGMSTEGASALVRFRFRNAPLAPPDLANNPTAPPTTLLTTFLAHSPWQIQL